MSYREKIERYKKQQLTEEETKEVEAEIEKTEAISDYLADRLMDDLDEDFFAKDGDEQADTKEKMEQSTASAKEFEVYVKKSIHRSFRRMGMVVGGAVLAVVLFVQFGMSPLMSSLYYNPTKTDMVETKSGDITYETSYSQIGMDFHVYAELGLPCKGSDNLQAFSNGYGNYQILITPSISFGTKRGTATAGQIRKGKLELYNPNYLQGPPVNYFAGYGLDRDRDFVSQMKENVVEEDGELTIYNQWFYGTLEDGQEAIAELEDDNTMYQAYVSFDRPKTFTEVNEILNSLKEQDAWPSLAWIAVYGSEDGGVTVGYDYDTPQSMTPVSLNKKYPELSLYEKEGYDDADYENVKKKMQDESVMTQHLVSMLRYMGDQHKFVNMMEEYTSGIFDKSIADYIEENGISSYGFSCIATKADMQKMLEMDDIIGIVPESWN